MKSVDYYAKQEEREIIPLCVFSKWYSQEIKENAGNIVELVRTNPDLAIRVFDVFHDKDLGLAFVARYQDSDDYHNAAYFMALDLGSSIQRRPRKERQHKGSINDFLPLEDDSLGVGGPGMDRRMALSELKKNIYDYQKGESGNHWMEESIWDNIVVATEK